MSTDIHTMIQDRVEKEIVTYHNGEGIVLPETISILTRSPLLLNRKDSTYKVIVRYKASVVDVPNGAEVSGIVESVLSSGLLCHVYDSRLPNPLMRIYVPIAIHTPKDQERIMSIRKGDNIRVRSINRKGSYADRIITMIGTFLDLVERPEKQISGSGELPAPGDESEYDARGDGDPLGPQADGMTPLPGDPQGASGSGDTEGPPETEAAQGGAAVTRSGAGVKMDSSSSS